MLPARLRGGGCAASKPHVEGAASNHEGAAIKQAGAASTHKGGAKQDVGRFIQDLDTGADTASDSVTAPSTTDIASASAFAAASADSFREGGARMRLAMGPAMLRALSRLDERLIVVLERGDIRFVRASWLLEQPEDFRMPRRQELEALEQAGAPSALLSPAEAVALVREGTRCVGVLS